MSFANKFGSFKAQVEEEVTQPVAAPKKVEKNFGHGKEKKVVVKAKTAPQQTADQLAEGGFVVSSNQQQRGGDQADRRGGRGGRGGGRGGDRPRTARGGRGDRPPRDFEGEDRPQTEGRGRGQRGDRGGRGGRGGNRDRPRYDRTTQQVEGGDNQGPAHHNRGDRQVHGFQGKPREQWHPMDRESGTGAGKKDQRKGGNRAGGNRENKHDNFPAEKVEEAKAEAVEEEKKEGEEPVAEEAKPEVEESKQEPQPEEEDEEALPGIDFADWEAQQQAKKTGVLATKQAREHVEINKDRIIENTEEKQRVQMGTTNVTGRESHAIRAGAGAELLGFAGVPDEEEGFERGSRGGRGGRGGRGDRQGAGRGGGQRNQ